MQKYKYVKNTESPIILGGSNSQKLLANNAPLTLVKNSIQANVSSSLAPSPGILYCNNDEEVIDAVKKLREEKLLTPSKVGAQPIPSAFIDLSKMNGIVISKNSNKVKVQGGALISELDAHTFPLGMAVPAGMVSHNRVADLIPTGGQNYMMHKYGFTTDHLQSLEVVLADGQLITVSASQNQDLFAAMKGGGKAFGIITTMEFDMQPIEKENVGGMLIYPMRMAKKVINCYRKYAMLTPNEMSASLLFLTLSNGLKALGVHSAWLGNRDEGLCQLGIFQGLLEPLADFTQVMPYYKLQKGLDPYIPGLPRENSYAGYFSELSFGLIEKVLLFAEKMGTKSRVLVNVLKGASSKGLNVHHSGQPINWYIEIIPGWINPKNRAAQLEWAVSFWDSICSYKEGSLGKQIIPHNDAMVEAINKYDPDRIFD